MSRIRYAVPAFIFFLATVLPARVLPAQNSATAAAETSTKSGEAVTQIPPPASTLPRGKKLMLKDGNYQLVREYKVDGDRVRYYSLDSSQWEEIPESLVDWDATKKIAGDESRQDAAILTRVHKQESAREFETLDVDASLEAAPGIFLPPGEGLFIFSGQAVQKLAQAQTDSTLSKKRVLEQVLVPVPVIPSRHIISINGQHAAIHANAGEPEFYMRVADSRLPELRLIRTKVNKDNRRIEHVDTLMTDNAESAETIGMQRWEIAKGVYRFTLSRALEPGEYVVAETLHEGGLGFYVWDFGIRSGEAPAGVKAK